MHKRKLTIITGIVLIIVVASTLLIRQPLQAADPPGLGNLTYNSNELFQPISLIDSPNGHGNATMVNGYLMVIYSSDGGGSSGNGGVEFWDVSDPRNPVLAASHDNADTHGLREPHGFAFSNDYPQDTLVAQGVDGIQFWDVSDPLNISLIDYMNLPGINQGDYSGDWWVTWQAPYVYVAGTGQGLYIVDATDPANPVLANQVSTSEMGGLSPGLVYAVGNLLVLMKNGGCGYTTMDISDPINPVFIQNINGNCGYSHLFAGDGKILTSGGNGDAAQMYVHQVTHDGMMSFVGQAGSGLGNGGYGSYQDGIFHSGFSSKYAKFDIATLQQLGTGTSGISNRDEDFGQVLGNLIFVGNDHNQATALIVHQTAPDTIGANVEWVHPADGAINQAASSRIGLMMSDNVDIDSVNSSTFAVRPIGGAPLAGKYSVQMGIVNFAPDIPLQAGQTYEVVVNGIEDIVGNAGGSFTSTFTVVGGAGPTPTPQPTATPGGPTPTPSPTPSPTVLPTGGLISNVSHVNYQMGSLAVGNDVYVDRTFTYASMPVDLAGEEYILTANDDKNGTGSDFLTFDLASDATVYVLFDVRASALPAWLSDWTATGDVVTTTDVDRDVFSKAFTAGTVVLGGNADSPMAGASSMYSVVAVGAAAQPLNCSLALSAAEVNTAVSFDVESVAGAQPIFYSWDFGDGTPPTAPSTSAATTHTYSNPGRYPVVLTIDNGNGTNNCTAVQIVHTPVTAVQPNASSSIIFNGTHAINVNPDNDTVTAVTDSDLSKAWEVPVGTEPVSLAAAPNGNIWVTNRESATISILDAANGNLLNTFALPYASQPFGIAFAPDGSAAYVALHATGQLVKLDLSGNIVGIVDVGPFPKGLAISGDSNRILVTRFISPENHGEVVEVGATSLSIIRTFELAFDFSTDTELSGRGVPNYISQVTISPDGTRAYVPSKKDNTARGLFRDGLDLNFENSVRTIVSQIDLVNNGEDLNARIDLNDRDMAQSVIFTPVGDVFFVAEQGSNIVQFFDVQTQQLLGQENTGRAPIGMAFNGDGSKLYVHNYMGRSVSVFDTSDLINGVNNGISTLGTVGSVSNELLDAQVLQGKRIFYNANDARMNQDGYLSCASCHLDGDSDGRIWDFTGRGEGFRNTITLRGRAGTGHGNVHWTANFDEIQDFENDIRNAFGGQGFLSDSDFANTNDPLGNPKAGLSPELDALAAYVASLTTVPDSPYRNPDGSLTADGQTGRGIFQNLNCQSCHSGSAFTDGLRHDVGTIQSNSGLGIGQPLAGVGFDTPTLKGIWADPPYLHNGQAATLLDLLNSAAHGGTDGLTATERNQLAAYLLQIDENEPGFNPPGPTPTATAIPPTATPVPPTATPGGGTAEWLEDFNLADGTTSDTGSTAWSVITSLMSAPFTFSVQNGRFESSDTDGEGIWESAILEIGSLTDVNISVDIQGTGTLDSGGNNADYLRVFYKLNGGAEVPITEQLGGFNGGNVLTVNANNLNGNTLQIVIRTKTTGSDEQYYWDNVFVSGTIGTVPTNTPVPPTNTATPVPPTPTNTPASGVDIKVNFQPPTSNTPAGYLADTGALFGDRGNGQSYGWDVTNNESRDRNIHADQRYDTLNHLQKNGAKTWEIALPNGTYNVTIVAGDPGFTDQTNNLNVEGVLFNDPDGQDNFDEYINVSVTVTDGRLTIAPASGASNAKINYIEISN